VVDGHHGNPRAAASDLRELRYWSPQATGVMLEFAKWATDMTETHERLLATFANSVRSR
jgi:hypothetical protein